MTDFLAFVLNAFERATSDGGGARGYTDYPTIEVAHAG
jgi:hypothetical protein